MDKIIEDLIEKGMGRLMDNSRDELAQNDKIYINDRNDEAELEQRYESLNLSKEQRMIVNDYITCSLTANHRYADISYIAGIKDTVGMLSALGLLKNAEIEE